MTKKNVTYFGILNYSSKFRKRQMRSRLTTKKQKNNGLSGRAVSDWTVLTGSDTIAQDIALSALRVRTQNDTMVIDILEM